MDVGHAAFVVLRAQETLTSLCSAAALVGHDGIDYIAEMIEQTLGVRFPSVPPLGLEDAGHCLLRGVLRLRDVARPVVRLAKELLCEARVFPEHVPRIVGRPRSRAHGVRSVTLGVRDGTRGGNARAGGVARGTREVRCVMLGVPRIAFGRPAHRVRRPAHHVRRPAHHVRRPSEDAPLPRPADEHPRVDMRRPALDVVRDRVDAVCPAADAANPTTDVARPEVDVCAPAAAVAKNIVDVDRPLAAAVRSVRDVARSTADASECAFETVPSTRLPVNFLCARDDSAAPEASDACDALRLSKGRPKHQSSRSSMSAFFTEV